jgi:hypothetical protein
LAGDGCCGGGCFAVCVACLSWHLHFLGLRSAVGVALDVFSFVSSLQLACITAVWCSCSCAGACLGALHLHGALCCLLRFARCVAAPLAVYNTQTQGHSSVKMPRVHVAGDIGNRSEVQQQGPFGRILWSSNQGAPSRCSKGSSDKDFTSPALLVFQFFRQHCIRNVLAGSDTWALQLNKFLLRRGAVARKHVPSGKSVGTSR